MTSAVLERTCIVWACANALFNKRDRNPLNFHKPAAVARRTTRLNGTPDTHRLSRHSLAAPAPGRSGRRRRIPWSAYHNESLRKPVRSFISRKSAARHPQEGTEGMDETVLLQRSLDESMSKNASASRERQCPSREGSRDETKPRRFPDEPLTSPPSHVDDLIETRSTRSASTASRTTNRLSLTLPILPPSAYPSRPTPASSTTPAFPPTPLDTPSLMSPVDPSDFITAIAAQERRVLELREELSRAESNLVRLKKQWATHEAYKKRAVRRNVEPNPGLGPAAELQDETAIRRSVELDRRKALLGQQNQQATPERSRRRVFTGSHTRTLSLLSPTKPSGGFSANDDESESSKLEHDSRVVSAAPVFPSKRASWTPRTTQSSAVKQLAEDLRTGLWTFVEDLRQATVGDEPITGHGTYLRGMDGNMRPTAAENQDTIRPAANPRPRVTSAFEETPKAAKQEEETMKKEEEAHRPARPLQRSKTDAGTTKPSKRFSWTPLTMDAYDDNDWSNWDSPSNSSPRWSGTTVNGDIIPSIPQKRESESTINTNNPLRTTPSKTKPSKTRTPSSSLSSSSSLASTLARSPPASPSKLEELLPPVLNRLTPSNIKRTAADFMKEWERSLSPPDVSAAPATAAAVGEEKEKGL